MQEATTLKRVKPEPSDGTPANKRLKPDELERVVTPEGDSQQIEIDHVVDPETRAREAIRAAEAAGDIIDVDALDDAATTPAVHQPAQDPGVEEEKDGVTWTMMGEMMKAATATQPEPAPVPNQPSTRKFDTGNFSFHAP